MISRGFELFVFGMLSIAGKWWYAIFIGKTPEHIEYIAHLTFDVLFFSCFVFLMSTIEKCLKSG